MSAQAPKSRAQSADNAPAANDSRHTTATNAPISLTSIDALFAWIVQSEELAAFKPRLSDRDHQAIFLSKDGFTQVILGEESFRSFDRMLQYALEYRQPNGAIICAGTTNQVQDLPLECVRAGALTLGLPTSSTGLVECIRSVHSFQMALANAHAEREILEETTENVKYVMSISRELNGERDIPKLLTLILHKAREICKADAGSIYTIDYPPGSNRLEDAKLRFRFTQNASIRIDFAEFSIPIDNKSIVGNAVLHQTPINIPDLYQLSDNATQNPFGVKHNRTFDQRIGYESHSMLTLPMFDISHRVIGVIQLINRKRDWKIELKAANDFRSHVVPFHERDLEYAEIVAQQAGIALENAEMHNEIQRLFDGFVNASVTAIEQRDPTTSGHSHRVAQLTTGLAEIVHKSDAPHFKHITFTDDQLREIKYASLLHDFGKLGVRENVLVKAKKLYPWQHDSLTERFELIRASLEIDFLRQQLNFMINPAAFPMDFSLDNFQEIRNQRLAELEEYFGFIMKANEPTVLEQGGFDRLSEIAKLSYEDTRGRKKNYLSVDELKALSVSRGSLTAEEFAEIQSHVEHTYEFLRKIPWGHRLYNVPEIAAKHHEKLDGSGYPNAAVSDQIPLQSRMMTIADIYDALTASDRPYKKAVGAEKALDIINMDVKNGKIDHQLFEVFVSSEVYKVTLSK
jgi:HD-GYP domain-containing protein (c-di-GMP phosphodiesterase class II)